MKLGVNIDHVATVRQARRQFEPDPVHAAVIAEMAGADSIVCHLREDRRHVNERDIKLLKEVVVTRLNLEMALSDEIIEIALDLRPHQITLVPEKRNELTTEGGLDVIANKDIIKKKIAPFKSKGIEVSVFIDPDRKQVETARNIGVEIVELHTGCFVNASDENARRDEYNRLSQAAVMAKNMRIFVSAGHGLTYHNVHHIAAILDIKELNIGHSIVSRSVLYGMEKAVRDMKALINQKRTI